MARRRGTWDGTTRLSPGPGRLARSLRPPPRRLGLVAQPLHLPAVAVARGAPQQVERRLVDPLLLDHVQRRGVDVVIGVAGALLLEPVLEELQLLLGDRSDDHSRVLVTQPDHAPSSR